MNVNLKQICLAKAITGSEVDVATIIKEVTGNSVHTMMNECKILDNLLQKHNQPFDTGWEQMKNDFINVAAANSIDEATLFIIFMEYLNLEKVA